MIQLGIFYLLPFICIFIFFGRLGEKYQCKTGMQIFIGLAICFGIQFILKFIISVLILKLGSAENPLDTIVKFISLLHISCFILGVFATYIYYRNVEKKFSNSFDEIYNDIENLGEK